MSTHARFSAFAILSAMLLTMQEPAAAADRIRVGEGPFITGGAFYVARDKGYFQKVGLDIDTKTFIDGAMAVPKGQAVRQLS